MTLNQDSPQINPDSVDSYIYDHALVDEANFIDIRALLAQLRQDYGEVDYFTPDNNPHSFQRPVKGNQTNSSTFCVAVFQRATRHNAARLAELVEAATLPKPKDEDKPAPAARGWLLPVTCLFALLIPFLVMAGSVAAVATLVG